MAAGLDHVVDGPEGTVIDVESEEDLARLTVSTELVPGASLQVDKLLAYGWSASRSMPALRDQVDAALASARRTGWDGLLGDQRQYLDEFWDHADVEVDGDDELQQAVRFALFQVVQAAARAERRAIPAKGLTGRGYDGHTFWDQETYTLPALTYVLPEAAQHALLWRYDTLPIAQERAQELHLDGAAFPWRTIHGEECSGYWPAGTAAFHINADIADAVRQYVAATGERRARPARTSTSRTADLAGLTARQTGASRRHDRKPVAGKGCDRFRYVPQYACSQGPARAR
jgi:alpha,alpha-trehalose phosphorylase